MTHPPGDYVLSAQRLVMYSDLNAAGRLSRPQIVIELLTSTDLEEARRLARTLADANAALYAAVHAGQLRRERRPSGEEKAHPISRRRLQELAGCSRYRQRSYERRMKISVIPNIHILGEHSAYALGRARQHLGLPAYKHTDYQGKINRHRRGAAYIAVRLPNSYHLPHNITVVHSRRQRTINRFLDGLCHLGSGGSDREEIVRLYHRDAVTAVRAGLRDQATPAYWPMVANSDARLWQTYQVRSNDFSRSGSKLQVAGGKSIPHSEFNIPHSKGGDLN